MNSKIAAGIGVAIGFAGGVFAGIFIARERYKQIVDEEIQNAINFYSNKKEEKVEEKKDTPVGPINNDDIVTVPKAIIRNPDLKAVAAEIVKDEGYVSKEEGPQDDEPEEDLNIAKKRSEIRYSGLRVISPAEFGDNITYQKLEFTLYSDGVLVDDRGFIEEDPDRFGDALDHFGEYEEDSVYIADDELCIYYAILKDLRNYSDLPKRMRRG